MKNTWIITCERHGFRYKVFLNATEDRLIEYIKTELPEAKSYSCATEEEIEAARLLHLPIYLY